MTTPTPKESKAERIVGGTKYCETHASITCDCFPRLPKRDKELSESKAESAERKKYSYQKHSGAGIEEYLLLEDRCVHFATVQVQWRAQQIIDALNAYER